jgi:flagellar hook-associated protein 3 FlgL
MRISDNQNYGTLRENISRSKERMDKLQSEASTMKKLNTPSDDPVGAAKVLEVRTEKMNNDQYQTNAKMAESFLTNSEQALTELSDLIVRAKEIAISQSSGASANSDTRLGVAEEVTQLYNQAVAAGNRRIGDRYLFGGYKTQTPPIDPSGRYRGDDGQTMVEIAKDVFLSMNVTGLEAFNTNPKNSADGRTGYTQYNHNNQQQMTTSGRAPASNGLEKGPKDSGLAREDQNGKGENVNVFDELQNLRIALLTGDMDATRNTLERFDAIHAKIVAERSKIGSRINGLQQTSQSIERHNLANAQLTTQIEDADMAQVVSDLAREEQVFKSSLSSSQKLIQPTLLDFLK